MSCDCAPTYLPAGGNAVRRITGEQAVGDYHLWTGRYRRTLRYEEF
jgi:hypothetical protein